eukprot:g150.t1
MFCSFLVAIAAIGTLTATTAAAAAGLGPCDIYAKGNAPCVAAHSMARALYATYDGPLYELAKSDGSRTDVGTMGTGGVADASQHDAFCGANATRSRCFVHRIYDQSPRRNHLGIERGAPNLKPPRNVQDNGVNFTDSRSKATVGGHKVYGALFVGDSTHEHGRAEPFQGQGYSNRTTSGVPQGDAAQSVYALFSGHHYEGGCCMDYGNAENVNASGQAGPMYDGSMEALYFEFGRVGADLEHGIYATKVFDPVDFRAAFLKGRPGNHYAVRSGDAQTPGSLTTIHAGPRPKGYEVAKKQGGIVLGIGGDNSPWGAGLWYEGIMTDGFASDETEAAVMANVVAADFKL